METVAGLAYQGLEPGDKQQCALSYKNTCLALPSIKSKMIASFPPFKSHAELSSDSTWLETYREGNSGQDSSVLGHDKRLGKDGDRGPQQDLSFRLMERQ